MVSDGYYHIYNRTNAKEKLFINEENYLFFLRQFKKYISPICEVYAYCLMPNHFHFAIKIKNKEVIEKCYKSKYKSQDEIPINENLEEKFISQTFSNFFNSYTKSFNKMHGRRGSLFSPNFKQKSIEQDRYLQQLIIYIHLNSVKHNVDTNFIKFPYSSYNSIVSQKSTLIMRDEVIELFNDIENFKYIHQTKNDDFELINTLIIDDL